MISFIEEVLEGAIVCNLSGNVELINKRIPDMLGYKKLELEQMKAYNIIEGWEQLLSEIQSGSLLSEELKVNANKNISYLQVSAYPLVNEESKIDKILMVFKEVNKDRKLGKRIALGQAVYDFDKIIGESEKFAEIIDYGKKIADSKSTILITGESGTGKEVFAQSIHNYSSRKDKPFVAVNCGAIPQNLIESEFFGYGEGAFTGAKSGGAVGKFQLANGGTIFLDEIGEMQLDMQIKLLRVIEEKVINPIGSTKNIPIDVRIIAATNKELQKEIEKGTFRRDLYYRLNVLPMRLPALRERKEDIPILIGYFMKKVSKHLNKKKVEIPSHYMSRFIEYSWPGNVREIENAVELMINTQRVHLPDHQKSEVCQDLHEVNNCLTLDCNERQHIIKILKKFNKNVTLAAKTLDIGRNTLYRKIEKYKIDLTDTDLKHIENCSNTEQCSVLEQ
ncbi:AAA domain-containing protein [Clostridium bovifaecis]|uniref:AAA domain-containing protein n=1 Tax=Clostridium bovifaecis TaxID=2184719 RepID=A0A6I6EWS5_9CLOT|nr:AAA domain-containing protein [Clostridium bovifaecis]